MLQAAGRVGEYSHAMIQVMDEPGDEVKEFQDIVIQLAKAVASSTAQLVLRAKTVSGECDDQQLQDNVIHSATRCAFATSQLVACARVCSCCHYYYCNVSKIKLLHSFVGGCTND